MRPLHFLLHDARCPLQCGSCTSQSSCFYSVEKCGLFLQVPQRFDFLFVSEAPETFCLGCCLFRRVQFHCTEEMKEYASQRFGSTRHKSSSRRNAGLNLEIIDAHNVIEETGSLQPCRRRLRLFHPAHGQGNSA